jgi:hypothetical protein
MKLFVVPLSLSLLVAAPAYACMGPQTESAQDYDASVMFEGRPTTYALHSGAVPGVTSGGLSKVTFEVVRTLRGQPQKHWDVLMRGSDLPKNLSDFQRRFGNVMRVGIRDFGAKVDPSAFPLGFQNRYFIVDAACSMNGEDWLLRPIAAHE